jgi:carbon storage regulator
MLVLSRKLNESIVINGKVVVTVLAVKGDTVRLGINAPLEIPVHRQEVYEKVLNQEVMMSLG